MLNKILVIVIFVTSLTLANTKECFSQDKSSEIDSIYKNISLKLTPERPYTTESFSIELYNQIYKLLRSKKYDFRRYNDIYENGNIIIKLHSGISWELLGYKQEHRAPLFFLIRLLINKENPKVHRRFEYLVFNSVCEQKPELAYKLIDTLTIFQDKEVEDNIMRKKLICTMAYDSLGNLCIIQ